VKGTITDPKGAAVPGANVEFASQQMHKTVATNGEGVYQADLPVGDYTMTTDVGGFRPFCRPLFRAKASASLTFDVVLRVRLACDTVAVNILAAPEDRTAAAKECLREYFFPATAKDGVPFQLYIRYVTRTVVDDQYNFAGAKNPGENPVFVAYNLFSLQADEVVYRAKAQLIVASGHVIWSDGTQAKRHPRRGAAMFKIEDGQGYAPAVTPEGICSARQPKVGHIISHQARSLVLQILRLIMRSQRFNQRL
jgi:hypothetical protein